MTRRRPRGVPEASSPDAYTRMTSARRRDTKPEMELRRALHRLGLRYVIDRAPLVGMRRRADVVFPRARVAVYVDGCFWHGCPTHGTWAKKNAEFWRNKVLTNRRRDADTDWRLAEAGWVVVRLWEHDDTEEAARLVAWVVRGRQAG